MSSTMTTARPSMDMERSAVRRTEPDERASELTDPGGDLFAGDEHPAEALGHGLACAGDLPGCDERGHRALATEPVGHALGIELALEGADADPVVRLAVAGGGRRDVHVEACLLELSLESVRLRLRLESRHLYRQI